MPKKEKEDVNELIARIEHLEDNTLPNIKDGIIEMKEEFHDIKLILKELKDVV